MKPWEDIAETLSSELKREVAQAYFSEKLSIEEAWEEYKRELQGLNKLEEGIILNACRLLLMLEQESLWDEFEKITHFSLKTCYHPQILDSTGLKRKLFEKLGKRSFAFTSKSKFVKLFLDIYQDLIRAYEAYEKKLKLLEETYEELKRETEYFNKKYDLSQILGFFDRLGEQSLGLGAIEEKEKIYEEISSTMKITLPKGPKEEAEAYGKPLPLKQICSELRKLAQKAYENHQEHAKDLLRLVSEKD